MFVLFIATLRSTYELVVLKHSVLFQRKVMISLRSTYELVVLKHGSAVTSNFSLTTLRSTYELVVLKSRTGGTAAQHSR